MFRAAWLALHKLIKAQPGILFILLAQGAAETHGWRYSKREDEWYEIKYKLVWFPEMRSLCWAWVYSRCSSRNYFYLFFSFFYHNPLWVCSASRKPGDWNQLLPSLSGNAITSLKSQFPGRSKLCTKEQSGPLFYTLLCPTLPGYQQVWTLWANRNQQNISSLLLPIIFSPGKPFLQVPFPGFPWVGKHKHCPGGSLAAPKLNYFLHRKLPPPINCHFSVTLWFHLYCPWFSSSSPVPKFSVEPSCFLKIKKNQKICSSVSKPCSALSDHLNI